MTKQPLRFTLFLLICLSIPLTATAQTVDIPDPNLRAAVEAQLGKAAGDTITTDDMVNLTELIARNANISDLTGLEHATNLTDLRLRDNNISDISSLSGLNNLTALWLSDNNISDISPVAGLNNLTALILWNNNISDISSLSGLNNLTALDLSLNNISDISSLSGLNNLTVLGLPGNSISDISPLSGLNSLRNLYLQNNNISDISPVAGLNNLTLLSLDGNNISDISPIAGLTNLAWMRLAGNDISDLSPLADNMGLGEGDRIDVRDNPLNRTSIEIHIPALQGRGVTVEFDDVITELVDIPDPNLRAAIEAQLGKAAGDTITTADMATLTRLEAEEAGISDLTGLEHATNLASLSLGDNNISDISQVRGLTNLTRLGLRVNTLSDVSPVADLTNLTRLDLVGNNISDVSVLANLTNLESLFLDGNPTSDMSSLAGLTQLTRLGLGGNNISDISPLADLTDLTWLRLGGNNISDISPLADLTDLTWLRLEDNYISDISPLAGLTSLTELWLWGNSISEISALAGLTNLTRLNLAENSISDISALVNLTNLTYLELPFNSISDLSPLVANTGVGSDDEVDVRGNPLNRASIETHIPALQGRGVMVEFDDVITELVDIPDSNLHSAIAAALGKAAGNAITTDDMANLRQLFAIDVNISDLTGLELATNLTELVLIRNAIKDISPLAKLTNLTSLRLSANTITDISPLAGLTNLTLLWLSDNNISDLSPLTGLTKLESLLVSGNGIEDISLLAGLTNLETLGVRDNNISDISPLAGLTNLETLWLYNNAISDLSPLAGLTNLRFLSLHTNRVLFLSPLVANTGLGVGDTIELWGNPLNEASIGTHIPALRARGVDVDLRTPTTLVKISGTVTAENNLLIVEVWDDRARPVEGVPVTFTVISGGGKLSVTSVATDDRGRAESQLTLGPTKGTNTVHATVEGISEPAVFSDVPEPAVRIPDHNLRAAIEAELRVTPGSTLTASNMARLTDISARNANISDLTGLETAINLTWLDLGSEYVEAEGRSINSNSVSDLSPLAGLTNLTFLGLSDNSISDISPVAELNNLTSLSLGNNNISDISPVAGLNNLTSLLLWDNSISDISPLVANTGLGEEDLVFVTGNPLSYLSLYTHIPALQSRGVTVVFDRPVETLSGHTDGVVSIAFSPDGSILASGSADNTVQLWDTVTELPIATLIGHTAMARSVAFSPDGSILASGGHDGTVRLWDVATRTPIDILLGHTDGVESVVFSPDGNTLASGGRDSTVRSWNPVTGQPIEILLAGSALGTVWSVAYSPDGNTIAIGLGNGAILLGDVANGLPKGYLTGHTGHVESVAFNRDGTMLASGSGDNTVRLWDAITGDPIDTLTGHAAGINSVAFSPDGTILASGSDDQTVRLWDAITGDPIDTLRGHTSWVRSVAFNRDGSVLASGSGDSTIRLWELAPPTTIEYTLSIPAGISLIHVPLKVTEVDGTAQTIESVGDLYDVLGGASVVNFLITYDSQTQEWRSFFVSSDKGTPADAALTDDIGIIAGLRVPVSVQLSGDPLGTNGSSTISLSQGLNVVGLPLRDPTIERVSDLFTLDGIGGNVPVIILTDGGEFKLVGRAGDPGDIEITGGQAFIMNASREAMVEISGDPWANSPEMAAAPLLALTGIEVGNTTPVLGLRGSIVDEGTGLKVPNFRVTVKNLSTRRAVATVTAPDGAGYRSTVVDIETGRAATVGDVLEISAQSTNPFIGVKPLRYTVTAEDVKQSLIQLPELVAYEIPAETELLPNYPNPFNPETWIPYRLAEDAFVTLAIYDLGGQVIRTLDVGHQVAAVYENRSKAIYWDGRNEVGEGVASGVYFYHLSAGDYSATRKMLIIK